MIAKRSNLTGNNTKLNFKEYEEEFPISIEADSTITEFALVLTKDLKQRRH